MAGRVRRPAWLICLLALPGWGQGIHAGLKIGVPITRYFQTGVTSTPGSYQEYSAATRRYTAGLSGEWRFTNVLGLEADVLYHRMGYVAILNYPAHSAAVDLKGNSWDFPFLLKYRARQAVRPYAAGGLALRYIGPVDIPDPSELTKRVYFGLSAAAGVEVGSERIRFLPELRYARWVSNIHEPAGLLRFTPNQLEFLLGLLF
jgi:hypothetical protein